MNYRQLPRQVLGLTLVMLLLVGCGGAEATPVSEAPTATSAPTEEPTPEPPTATATPTEVPLPETVRISASGDGDFATLEEAIERLVPDSTVLLDAGDYELSGPLVITKSVTIQGAGVDVTAITNPNGGKAVLAFEGDHLTIKDLSLERTGEYASDIVHGYAGEIDLENCRVTGGAGSEDDSVKGYGILLVNDTVATITNCSVEGNMWSGIGVADNAKASIDQVTCSNNKVGVVFTEESTGEIRNSTITGSEISGIVVGGSAQVDIVDNTIKNNDGLGIYFKLDAAGGQVRDNVLGQNNVGGLGTDIQIWEEFSPALIGNTCDKQGQLWGSDSDQSGIVFIARGSLPTNPTVQKNSCAISRCSTPNGSLLSMTCQ